VNDTKDPPARDPAARDPKSYKPTELPTAIPAALVAATDRLTRLADRGEPLSRRITGALDRLSGTPRLPEPPEFDRPQQPAPQPAAGAPPQPPEPPSQAAAPEAKKPKPRARRTEWEPDELVQDAQESGRRQILRLARLLLRTMVVMFVVFVAWAWWFKIEEVTRGDGKVIASSQTQIVANLEGGIVAAVLVREGDRVEKDQVLLRLDNAPAQAQYRDNRAKYLSLSGQVARLTAELSGQPLRFTDDLMREAPEVVRSETTLMTARREQLEAQLAILRDQRRQRQQELADLRNKAVMLDRQLGLVQEQLRILEPLALEGLAPRVDVIRAQRDLAQTQTELGSARLQIPRAEAALQEAERKIEERQATFRADAQKELNERRTQLEGATELTASDRDRVRRTEVTAPRSGIVKQIHVKTIGGVVKAGQDLVELVPVEDTLLVEVKIRPADIGFVHTGQKASVKISAYDYAIYGQLDATVENISADTIVDERDRTSEPFFRVRLRTTRATLGTPDRPLPIQPGMGASADIETGQRSLLTYLTKPIFKTFTGALGER
jgi:adhesin transport system membrane fusion protein